MDNTINSEIKLFIDSIAQEGKERISTIEQTNSPKMGWFSIYTPEEIIHAANIMPFRIRGDLGSASVKSRAVLFANFCPYILSCFEEGMQGIYSFLDGVVMVNTCDARRRLYDAWRRYLKTPFTHIIDLPKIVTPESKDYFRDQFFQFKKAIENHFKREITEKSLKASIVLWNETRSLLKQLYELRKSENPQISGSQALTVVKASMGGNRKVFNQRLSDLLDRLKHSPDISRIRNKRILITGSYFDQLDLIKMIEKLGAVVVCEDLSNGIKYFEGKVDIDKEPMQALADYYLEKSYCARMVDSEKRSENILKLVRDYKVDAVIYFALKFCDSNLIDFPYQKNKLNEAKVPVLFLEGERTLINLSQLKTRIQAFLEISGAI